MILSTGLPDVAGPREAAGVHAARRIVGQLIEQAPWPTTPIDELDATSRRHPAA